MLVLTRGVSEVIEIDPRQCPVDERGLVRVMVVSVDGGRVRLGVDADRRISVNRKEVVDRIKNDPPHRRAG